jgi:hypothetical protein
MIGSLTETVVVKMKYDVDKALRSYINIREMLKGLPRELWSIFLPDSPKDLPWLETAIIAFKRRELEREQVISIQKLCGFPLRPNASLRETNIMARIEGLRNKLRQRNKNDRQGPDEIIR